MEKNKDLITTVNKELSLQLSNDGAMKALLATSFKGFKDPNLVKQACFEMMMRGYEFGDIIKKKIYAIPYKKGYSLVQSINDVRAIAMKNGQAGKTSPIFEEDKDGNIISCEITVKKRDGEYVDDYTAKVYFDEYYAGNKDENGNVKKNQWGEVKPTNWDTKPRTMIAKVAEMHALRMAFPEDLPEVYTEEEFEKEVIVVDEKKPSVISEVEKELENAKTKEEVLKIHNKYKGNGKDADKLILDKINEFKETKTAEVVEEKKK